jgi:prophage regulatory protein
MNTQETQTTETPATVPMNSRILRLNEVKLRTGLSRSSIYAFMKAETFPQHISLGERCVGWYEHEIDAWVASRQRVPSVRG